MHGQQNIKILVSVTSLPLGSLVVGLQHFSLWTGTSCGISCADDGTVIPLRLRASLVSAGEDGVFCLRGYLLHFSTHCNPLTLVIVLLKHTQHLDAQFAPHATYV